MNIVVSSIVALVILMAILTFTLPAIKARASSSSTTESSLYFYQFGGGISLSSYTIDPFPVIFASLLFILGPLLFACAGKSHVLKFVGYSLALTSVCFGFFLFSSLKASIESMTNSGYVFTSKAGYVCVLIYSIVTLIAISLSLFDELFGEKIETLLAVSNKGIEERLIELNSIYSKKLISTEEFDERRKAILNEK